MRSDFSLNKERSSSKRRRSRRVLIFLETRRGAPRKDVIWKAESPTKRLCLPLSVNALARLLKDNHRRRGYTGLTASMMNVKCHTKHENRRSLYCSSSSHQKSVSADDKSKHNTPSPSVTRTDLLTLALYMNHSGGSFGYRCIAVTTIHHAVCVFV